MSFISYYMSFLTCLFSVIVLFGTKFLNCTKSISSTLDILGIFYGKDLPSVGVGPIEPRRDVILETLALA